MDRFPSSTPSDKTFNRMLLGMVALVFSWSAWRPADRFTWFMEVFPVVVGIGTLIGAYPRWRFCRLVSSLIAAHALILIVGGHYTYAAVPIGSWFRDTFHLARNHYDRLGHFMQGFVPAMIAREILIRKRVIPRGPWLCFIVLAICLAISASYELLEWQTAIWTGAKADAFLGTQGDPWDTQWDMTWALVGAIMALVTLSRAHNRSMALSQGSVRE